MSDYLKEMQDKAKQVRERMGSGELPFMKRMDLTGKRAIVKPGESAVVRLLPRWDIQGAWVLKEGKPVKNPKYKGGQIYLEAFEHWWDGEGGQKNRAWCMRQESIDLFGRDHNAPCPICEAAAEHEASHDEDDKKFGRSLKRREVFLYNAIARDPNTKKRVLAEDGGPDFRVLPAQNTIFVGIVAIMTGDGEGEFARGDISHPKTGFDLKLTRPTGGGERWKTDCAQKSTPLFTDEERAIAKDWVTRLVDLPEWVKSEMKEYDSLYKSFHGVGPKEAGEPATGPAPTSKASPATAPAPEPAAPDEAFGSTEETPPAAEGADEGGPWGFDLT